MDADGVLSDGRLHVGANGEDGRAFFARDGLGIRLGQRRGQPIESPGDADTKPAGRLELCPLS